MENKVVSNRGIRLTYRDHYVQAVVLPDGRKLVLTGTTYGAGSPISALSEIAVAKKSDLKWVLQDLKTYDYEEVNGNHFNEELRALGKDMPWN